MEWIRAIVFIAGGLWVLRWLLSPTPRQRAERKEAQEQLTDDMRDIGTMAGLMGGEMDDAFVGRFALRRTQLNQRDRKRKAAKKRPPKEES